MKLWPFIGILAILAAFFAFGYFINYLFGL